MLFLLSAQNVIIYLLNIGLCSVEEAAAAHFESRDSSKNFNLRVNLPENRKPLIKQELYQENGESKNEFFYEWQFHTLLQEFPELGNISALTSEVIHFDEPNSIIVYKYLTDYLDLNSFYHQQQVFPTSIATAIGTALASLHRATLNRYKYHSWITQTPEGQFGYEYDNPAQGIERITPEIFGLVPTDALKFFILYQGYESLATAVADLATYWHPCCLTHNDLKLDNILVNSASEQLSSQAQHTDSSIVRLVNWKRCGWGNPVFDLGTILASYLSMWLHSLVVDSTIELEESLSLAITPLEMLQPSILALTKAYLHTFPSVVEYRPNFLPRLIQSTGLALIGQIEAMIQSKKYFDNTGICMLQFAKTLVCQPKSSVLTVFGISESEFTSLELAVC